MKRKKPKKTKTSAELYRLARGGASVHQILNKLNVSYDEAQQAIQAVAEDNKQAGPAYRANLRNLIAEQATGALAIIMKMASDEAQKPEIRLRAAEVLLKHAASFVDESVMRSWQERPDVGVEAQPTIFDFGPIIEDDGSIVFTGKPQLRLVNED